MGSIAAVLAKRDLISPDPVKRMLYAAPHRGDETETLTIGEVAMGISYRRDRKDAWIASVDGVAVAFAGVLDDAAEWLRHPPIGKMASPDAASILLRLFRKRGTSFLPELRGQFAAMITDGRTIWAFRDQIGFAPLHLRDDPSGVYLASEAKQVVAGSGIASEPDIDVVERIYFGNFGPSLGSPLKGVDRIPKARLATCRADSIGMRRYWYPGDLLETARLSDGDIRERFETLMTRAVRRCLTGSDVVSLSGGIDSPAVAAFAARSHRELTGRPPAALSEVFPSYPSVDETSYIEMVADHLSLDLHTFEPPRRRLHDLDRWAELVDGPIPTWSPTDDLDYYETARALGFRNILVGDLAESVADNSSHLMGHLLWKGRWGSLARHVKERISTGARPLGVALELATELVPRRLQLHRRRQRNTIFGAPIPPWMDPARVNAIWDRVCVPARHRWEHRQLAEFQGAPGLAIGGQEVLQEYVGVRVRHPWGDVDLWQFFLSLRAEVKFPSRGRKVLVRKLLRGHVPDPILDRTDKTVFNEWAMAQFDYPALRRWLIDPGHRLPGIDYALVKEALEREDLEFPEYIRMQDLAFVHAFLERWR